MKFEELNGLETSCSFCAFWGACDLFPWCLSQKTPQFFKIKLGGPREVHAGAVWDAALCDVAECNCLGAGQGRFRTQLLHARLQPFPSLSIQPLYQLVAQGRMSAWHWSIYCPENEVDFSLILRACLSLSAFKSKRVTILGFFENCSLGLN